MMRFTFVGGLVLLLLAACVSPEAKQHEFLIYFLSDQADLTPTGHQIIVDIVAESRRAPPVSISVGGEADGDTPRDADLAAQRATNVIKALQEAGLDPALKVEPHTTKPIPGVTGVAAHRVRVVLTDN